MKQTLTALAFSLGCAGLVQAAAPSKLDLQKGDHVALIGNALADRMQHDAFFETLIYKAFPDNDLTFRDLGFAADELTIRQRSENFGSPDEWLTKAKANVVLAFFGFNESFAGPAGVEKFKGDLTKFIADTKKQNYSGKGAPRLVLFSPIANEKMADPNFPDPTANNANLQLYTTAMAEVAAKNDVQFVDLFNPSLELYKTAKLPLTFNGIHLTEAGYKALSPIMFRGLLGADAPLIDDSLEKLRAAILDKNEMWFSRYRTVDGYNVYGGRSQMAYESGPGGPKITNFKVMQEEMAVRDAMTANRDQRIWAVAHGGDMTVADADLPPITKLGSNLAKPAPYLSGEEAIKHMTLPKGCKVNLFASEEQFPELIKPVQMAWDTKGRLWVAAWRTYPERTPSDKVGDSLIVLEDTDGDGKADKVTHFIDGLNCPTGFQFYKDGVLLMQAPDLWYLRDTNGDGKADWRERVLNGMDSADSHHTTNAMCLEPGGATYLSDGVFHRTQVETATGPVRNSDAAIYRFEPRTNKFERYVAYGFANPHGRVFDSWGNDFITDATGNETFFAPAFSGHIDGVGNKHPGMKQFWNRPSRPCPGTNILSSKAWPDEFNGNFLNCNVIGFQGIFRVKVSEDGSGLKGETLDNFVSSNDPNFRPTAVNVGPDGAVYFADWSNAIIGHLQHAIRDPNRDHVHGRIYRVTYDGKTTTPAKIYGQPVEALLELLKDPDNEVRTRAKIELGKHDSAQVVAAVKTWVAALDKADKNYEHNVTEALWVHQWHNVVDLDLLKRVLRSPDARARAAATRVLCYWRDRVPEVLALLKVQADDESARVRLEAVRAASFFNGEQAKEAYLVATEILKQPSDYYLEYTFKETTRQLQSLLKEPVYPTDPKALAFMLEHTTDADLMRAPAVEPVLLARVERRSIDINQRLEAIQQLGKVLKTTPQSALVTVLSYLDSKGNSGAGAAQDLAKVLPGIPADELAKVRTDLLGVATKAKEPGVRQVAWAAVMLADDAPAKTWAEGKSEDTRQSLIDAVGLLYNPAQREAFQPLLSAELADAKSTPATRAAVLRALPLMGVDNAKANFATLAAALQKDEQRTTAARAIMQLPRESWDKSVAGPVVESIVAWAKTVPADKRTSQEYVETAQTGMELAGLLPSEQGAAVRKELRGLGVRVFVVKTVREQMRYDTSRLVVEAGKPFEVIFENLDFMPHNFVVVAPGARQAVAESVKNQPPTQLDPQGRAYFPRNDKRVLGGTVLTEAGQKHVVKLTAPASEGDYQYVCTFPDHWQMMWGTLIVTKDVDGYLQTHAEATPSTAAPASGHEHQHGAK